MAEERDYLTKAELAVQFSEMRSALLRVEQALTGTLDGKRGLLGETTIIKRDLMETRKCLERVENDVAKLKTQSTFAKGMLAAAGGTIGAGATAIWQHMTSGK